MNAMRFFRLRFSGGLHVESRGSGEPGAAEETVASDTLSAALCVAWDQLFAGTEPEFFLDPPFRVSTAFPFVEDTFLFPAPAWWYWTEEDPRERKRLKKIRWLSQDLFKKVLDGRTLKAVDVEAFTSHIGGVPKEEAGLAAEAGARPPWAMGEQQRVSVDRLSAPREGGLFWFERLVFSPDAGLWCLVEADEERYPAIRAVFDYLGDTGIGADRNCGMGHFHVVEEGDFPRLGLSEAEGWLTLSLFNPGSGDDIDALRTGAYGLSTRAGWISGLTLGRPPVKAFTEGSWFANRPKGRVLEMFDAKESAELGLRHPVMRDLRAVSVPCRQPAWLKEKTHEA